MAYDQSLIVEVDAAMANASAAQRGSIARKLTDLFSSGVASYSNEVIQLFDLIFAVVAQNIDPKALKELKERLAATNITLSEFAKQLAMVNDIEIAGPVLAHSETLSDEDLVEVVKTRSRDYLLAVASRKKLSEAVTDAFIERGIPEITRRIVDDLNTPISHLGFVKLFGEAKTDLKLAEAISKRPDMPAELRPFLKLVRKSA